MQLINKGTNNTLVFTLREKQTLTNPYFLFSFTGQVERNPKYFISADLSSFPDRYNKFLITETSGSENLTSGVISLSDAGTYEYAIYEQSSSSNLNPTLCDNLVPLEIGLIKVIGSPAVYREYDGQSKTTITYGE